jgi:excisionase family DNA binding protein
LVGRGGSCDRDFKRQEITALNPDRIAVTVKEATRLLTVPQAAAYLSCPVWTVRTLIWNREIPVIKPGKGYLIDRQDLDRWIDRTKATL